MYMYYVKYTNTHTHTHAFINKGSLMEPDFDMVTIYASVNMSHFITKREKDTHTHTMFIF